MNHARVTRKTRASANEVAKCECGWQLPVRWTASTETWDGTGHQTFGSHVNICSGDFALELVCPGCGAIWAQKENGQWTTTKSKS